jgi:SAM-dependent methyltransferase
MRCVVCDANDWENIDRVRLKPSGMHMCKSCGFVSYPSKYQSEEEIKAYYRKSYRAAPQASNLFTGERKLQYHVHFLSPLFEEWKKAGLDKPVVGEIGSAMGMFLNWVKQCFPEADVHGTELTETFRRVAFHEYGIRLEEEFDKTKKYDLIASYHVLEHQLDADIRLKEYAECLSDAGLFYLSVPIWFRDANNGAANGFDIEYYWAPDHINSWGEEHVEWIIAKAGLEIVGKNTDIYGNTYLLKKSEAIFEKPAFDRKKYLETAQAIYDTWLLLQENKTAEAIARHKNCPAAWMNHYELNRAHFHKDQEGLKKFIKDAIESCPNTSDITTFIGDVLIRYERFDEAYDVLAESLKKKPNNPTILIAIANCYRQKAMREKNAETKARLFEKSIGILRFTLSVSTETVPQALSWIYHDEAQLPMSL